MKLLFSTIGKKIQIAVSGSLLIIFLFFHLINNLVLFSGSENFNSMVEFLESIKLVVRIMEVGLLLLLLIHTFNAIQITINNRKRNITTTAPNNQFELSSLNSRTMAISGSIILLFLFLHLGFIWWTYQIHAMAVEETYYDVLLRSNFGYLNHTPTAIFYIIAILSIAFHLKHGFQSALKTFGVLNYGTSSILYSLSFIIWGLIPMGFIIIVICIQCGVIK